jgi:beta-glucosidase
MRLPLFATGSVIAVTLFLQGCQPQSNTAETTPADPEISALISRMTLEEKLAQLSCIWIEKSNILDENGDFSPTKMKASYPHGVGCFARPQDTMGMEAPQSAKV